MTAGPPKVVLDTNVPVSGHFWKGPPARRMLAVDAGLARLVLSNPILTEFGEKLIAKFDVAKTEVEASIRVFPSGPGLGEDQNGNGTADS